jgi:hypothetical protein
MNTPVKRASPDTKPRFNYFVLVDVVVVACILVIAGRPDGLAITCSAVIVATCALVYRCSSGIKSSMAAKPRAPAPPLQEADGAPPERIPDRRAKGTSWLRDAD